MHIDLDKTSGKFLYIRLYDAITAEISNGNLPNGSKLPARRILAENLGIAETTVDSAYKMLQDTGYILSIPRQGYVVSFQSSPFTKDVPWETVPDEEIVFSPNGIDITHFSRITYAKIMRDILYNDGADVFSYPEKGGEFLFRNALSKYLYSFRDIKCSPARIVIGAGEEYLLASLAAIFPADTGYILENPCNTHFYHTLYSYRHKIVMLPAELDGFDIDALYSADGKILCLEPDTRCPRSRAMPKEVCRQILAWAYAAPDRYIIENGYDSELQSAQKETLYQMDTQGRVIYLNSFSRTLSPAVKTSYMVLPESLLELWKREHVYYYSLVSKQEQYALAEFINRGHFTKHYKDMRKIYKERREYLKDGLIHTFGDDIKIYGDSASTYISASFASRRTDEVKKSARKAGVKLLTMNTFNVLKDSAPIENDRLVIGIGDLNNEKIRRGIRILYECFNK